MLFILFEAGIICSTGLILIKFISNFYLGVLLFSLCQSLTMFIASLGHVYFPISAWKRLNTDKKHNSTLGHVSLSDKLDRNRKIKLAIGSPFFVYRIIDTETIFRSFARFLVQHY
jgi:hypothetical protein